MWRVVMCTVFVISILACGFPSQEEGDAGTDETERTENPGKNKNHNKNKNPARTPSAPEPASKPVKDVKRRGELALGTDSRGEARTAMIHVPERAQLSQSQSAIVVLHGGKNNSARDIMDEWRNQLDEGFILAFPNGQRLDTEAGAWRAEGPDRNHVDVIGNLRQTLIDDYNVAPERLFVAGLSSGAHMTYQLSCLEPDWFAGYAVVNHYLKASTKSVCDSKGVPMLMMFGTDDESAGWGPKNDPNGQIHVIGAPETLNFFESRNGCDAKGARTTLPDRSGDRTQVHRQQYTCRDAVLEYYEMEGGGHSWPGGSKKRAKNHCRDVDGAEIIVDFFRRTAKI